MRFPAVFLFALMSVLSGCESVLPHAGPAFNAIGRDGTEGPVDYDLIPIDAEVAQLSVAAQRFRMPTGLLRALPEDYAKLIPGDVLAITIWEADEEGVFTGLGGRNATLQEVTVDELGQIHVPYVGYVDAKGKTLADIRDEIVLSLGEQAINPQVQASLIASEGRNVSIQGQISSPGVYQLQENMTTLLQLLAKGGGLSVPIEEAVLNFRRGSEEARLPMSLVYERGIFDIALRPGDSVIIGQDKRYYITMGAVAKTGRQRFSEPVVTLMDAIAVAGGLNDQQADPTGVFVFRFEDEQILSRIRHKRFAQTSGEEAEDAAGAIETTLLSAIASKRGALQKVVYQLDLARPDSIFNAQQFQLHDDDVVYVTNAPLHEWRKLFSLVSSTLGTASQITNVSNF